VKVTGITIDEHPPFEKRQQRFPDTARKIPQYIGIARDFCHAALCQAKGACISQRRFSYVMAVQKHSTTIAEPVTPEPVQEAAYALLVACCITA
jgi:hypothetical protein